MRKYIIIITVVGFILSAKQSVCQDPVLENLRLANPVITPKEINASIGNLQDPNINEDKKALNAQLLFIAAAKGKEFNSSEITKIIEISEKTDKATIHEWLVKVIWKIAEHRSTNNLTSIELNAIRMSMVKNIKENRSGLLWAIYALTELGGDKKVEDNLINIIKVKPTLEMQAIQLAAAIYLGSTKSEKAIVPIKESLIDLVKSLNIELKEPQFGLEAPEIPYNSYKIVYANALITLGKHYNINIGDFISDGNKEIKYLGAYVLGKLGDKNQVPVLCESLLKNENPYERKLAAEVLGELGDKSAIKSLSEAYKNDGFGLPGISGGYPVREAARRSLINLGFSIK